VFLDEAHFYTSDEEILNLITRDATWGSRPSSSRTRRVVDHVPNHGGAAEGQLL
jgi:hypothetical protein